MFERFNPFINRDVLTSIKPPGRLHFRENQVNDIAKLLGYAINNSTPPHHLLVGAPGSGKTATLLYVLDKLKQELEKSRSNGVIGYTIAGSSAYQTLVMLARACGMDIPFRGLSLSEMWYRFSGYLEDKVVILVIDEIDKMMKKDGVDLLYYLSRRERTCAIGITNRVDFLETIRDPRVASSYRPRPITFPLYDASQLEGILKERAEKAFKPNIFDGEAITYAAALAAQRNGDARYGLDLLLFAGDMVGDSSKKRIDKFSIDRAQEEVEKVFMKTSVLQLPYVPKLLLYLISHLEGKTPSYIYRSFNNNSVSQLSERRLSSILHELESSGFITITRKGKKKRRGVEWNVGLSDWMDGVLIKKILSDDPLIRDATIL
jgi:cell division control protein 6